MREDRIKGKKEQKKKTETINISFHVRAASSSTQSSVFAVLDALSESKPCRQAAICHLGSCPVLLCGAKMAPSPSHSEELHSNETYFRT